MSALDLLGFLSSVDPFSRWSERDKLALADLADRAEVWSFAEGDVVRFPDDTLEGVLWVAEGCLVAGIAERCYVGVRERLTMAGETVKGQTAGRFVQVSGPAWRSWLQKWPAAGDLLGEVPPPPLPRSLAKSPLILSSGESVQQVFRKAPPFLFLRSMVPFLFFLGFLGFGALLSHRFGDVAPWWALWLLPGTGLLVTAGLLGLVTWEWSASVLVITDRSLLIRQIDVWTHRSDFEKLALDRIRESIFTAKGWLYTLLRLVDLEVEGDSPRGRVVFRGLSQDSRFLEALGHLKAQLIPAAIGRREIRQALTERAAGTRGPVLETPSRWSEPVPRQRRFSWRSEGAEGVWFRHHPWTAWRRCLPWSGWMALVIFLAAVAWGFWPAGLGTIAASALLLALFPLAKIVWEIWDWAGDRLSVQGDKILLVHRKPLWSGEVRQEGCLDQVQQVGVRKDTLTALLFDFGQVTISLGGSDPMVFEDAHHPEWVQNEIFHHRTELLQAREAEAARTRLGEMTEVLDTWDEARRAGYFTEASGTARKEKP
jgi:hypothetical protein